MLIAIVAGEYSGDNLGASLIRQLKISFPNATFVGIGGPKMAAEGCEILYSVEELAVFGLLEVIRHLPRLLRIRRKLINILLAKKPTLYIGIDAPDFNLPIENKLHKHAIKTIHYISPTVWAWRQGRVKKIARAVDLMLTIFPFEVEFYKRFNIKARFVGHPLADEIPLNIDRDSARKELGLPRHSPLIAILPGSRDSEIKYLARDFLLAAKWCYARNQRLNFVIPVVRESHYQIINQLITELTPGLPIKLLLGKSQGAMAAANAVLLASGTATLEATLCKRPMVVAYRLAPLTYQIGKRLIKADAIAIPNLLLGYHIVPEYIQDAVKPDVLGQALMNFIEDPLRCQEIEQTFTTLHNDLRCRASEIATHAIAEVLGAPVIADAKVSEHSHAC